MSQIWRELVSCVCVCPPTLVILTVNSPNWARPSDLWNCSHWIWDYTVKIADLSVSWNAQLAAFGFVHCQQLSQRI